MKKLKAVIQKLINRFLNRRDRGEVHYINGYEILPAPLKKMRSVRYSSASKRATNPRASRS